MRILGKEDSKLDTIKLLVICIGGEQTWYALLATLAIHVCKRVQGYNGAQNVSQLLLHVHSLAHGLTIFIECKHRGYSLGDGILHSLGLLKLPHSQSKLGEVNRAIMIEVPSVSVSIEVYNSSR